MHHYLKFRSLPLWLTIFNLCIFSAVASNNELSISGKVVTCCGTPVSNATIKLISRQFSCTTDSTGNFHLSNNNASVIHQPMNSLNQEWEKIEIFDLRGNRLLKHDRVELLSLSNFPEIAGLSCIILRITANSIITSYKMLAPFSFSKMIALRGSSHSYRSLLKSSAASDSLHISHQGYVSISVPVTNFNCNLEPIFLLRTIDRVSNCNEISDQIDSGIKLGYSTISDSLKHSEAHFRWSTTGYSLPVPGKPANISLDVKCWGVQSNCSITATTGSHVKKVHSIIGLSGLNALKPVLTLRSVSGGVRLTAKSTIDPKSYIILHHGFAANEAVKRIESIKVYENPLPQPPLDSFAIINYIKSLYKEHTFYFADSGSPHQDTLHFKDVSSYNKTKMINSHISITGKFINNVLISSGTVYIHNTSSITNSFIMAQKVIIDGPTDNSIFYASDSILINQGNHNSQFFSYSNIVVGKEVKPGPYCTWIMLRTSESSGTIHFLENKNLSGVAICVNDTNFLTYNNTIVIDSGSIFKGYLITNGYLMMQFVKIIGSIYTYSIASRVNGISYINYLYDVDLRLPENELYFPLLNSKFSDFSYSEISSIISCF